MVLVFKIVEIDLSRGQDEISKFKVYVNGIRRLIS